MAKFRKGDKVEVVKSGLCAQKGETGTIEDDGSSLPRVPFVRWDNDGRKEAIYEANLKLIGGTMELKDKDVMEAGDKLHFDNGNIEGNYLWQGKTVRQTKRAYEKHDRRGRKLIKVTREGSKNMKEKKEYPKKFYAQRCMTNDDPTDLRIGVNPAGLDMDYPVLEIISSKNGFAIRQVKLTAKTVITAKEVK